MARHPIQPLVTDHKGILRFKGNKIVEHLLANSEVDLNEIARLGFPREDREQFAQLIGYSHSGFSDLPYVSDGTYYAAQRIHEAGETDIEARLRVAEDLLETLRSGLKEPIAQLYGRHPDDLTG